MIVYMYVHLFIGMRKYYNMMSLYISIQLEYSNERYQLLESHNNGQKREVDALREKTQQLSNALTKHQLSLNSVTQDLLATREKLTKAEISCQTLTSEKRMLMESEKRVQAQYENLLREQKGQNVLLINLQSIQNSMEKNEFEMKTRLGAQIQSLEREVTLLKQKLHSEEDRRTKMSDAYTTQVKDLEGKLERVRTEQATTRETLRGSEQSVSTLSAELSDAKKELQATRTSLQEAKDRLIRLEQDPGNEFRQKIRLLERNFADSRDKNKSLETQLDQAKQHVEQYKSMSLANEEALRDLNKTSEEFRSVTAGEGIKLSYVAIPGRNQTLFRCVFQLHYCV